MTLNVFDIVNASCLLEIDCSDVGFLRCCPTGTALNLQGIMEGRFQVAIQNRNVEICVWEAMCTLCIEGIVNGWFLCVAAYFPEEKKWKCVILDIESLEPFCMMSRVMYSIIVSLFHILWFKICNVVR